VAKILAEPPLEMKLISEEILAEPPLGNESVAEDFFFAEPSLGNG